VAVDDGSRDNTAAVLHGLMAEYPQLKVLSFRRNYGQTAAMQAGFDAAKHADVVVTMDGDLQNDPYDIPRMLETMKETGADMVCGWRKNRQDEAKRVWISKIANKILVKVTGVDIHDNGCSLKAYKGELLQDLKIYGEMHRFIPAVASQFGAKIVELPVNHAARQFGVSKYGFDRTIRVALDMVQLYFFRKFLHRPMHAFGYVGLMLLVPGFLMGAYLTLLKLFGAEIGGRPLLMLSVLLIVVGVQLLAAGVLGEMLTRIYHEPQGRKQYTLRKTLPAPMKPSRPFEKVLAEAKVKPAVKKTAAKKGGKAKKKA